MHDAHRVPPSICRGFSLNFTGETSGRRNIREGRIVHRQSLLSFLRGVLAVSLLAGALVSCANPWERIEDTPATAAIRAKVHQGGRVAHGNYCGFGTADGTLAKPPVDRLDAICQKHDICYTAGIHHCHCDEELRAAVSEFIADPQVDEAMRRKARIVRSTFALPVCRIFPYGFMPPRDPRLLDDVDTGRL